MAVQSKKKAIKTIHFFHGLTDQELSHVADLCKEQSYSAGEICQTEGQSNNRLSLITKGRLGTVIHISKSSSAQNQIVLEIIRAGDCFGWPALIKGLPWATIKALDPTNVLTINADVLLDLCEKNNHVGYVVMRNLSSLIASRLKRTRMSILNAIVAIKGEW